MTAIRDPKIDGVLDRLHRSARKDVLELARVGASLAVGKLLGRKLEAADQARLFKDLYIPVNRDQGLSLYVG